MRPPYFAYLPEHQNMPPFLLLLLLYYIIYIYIYIKDLALLTKSNIEQVSPFFRRIDQEKKPEQAGTAGTENNPNQINGLQTPIIQEKTLTYTTPAIHQVSSPTH